MIDEKWIPGGMIHLEVILIYVLLLFCIISVCLWIKNKLLGGTNERN